MNCKIIRDKIISERGNKCSACNKTNCRLVVHHIDEQSPYRRDVSIPNNDEKNLQVLCYSCHRKTFTKRSFKPRWNDTIKNFEKGIDKSETLCYTIIDKEEKEGGENKMLKTRKETSINMRISEADKESIHCEAYAAGIGASEYLLRAHKALLASSGVCPFCGIKKEKKD